MIILISDQTRGENLNKSAEDDGGAPYYLVIQAFYQSRVA